MQVEKIPIGGVVQAKKKKQCEGESRRGVRPERRASKIESYLPLKRNLSTMLTRERQKGFERNG